MIGARQSLLVVGDILALFSALIVMTVIRFNFATDRAIIGKQFGFFAIMFIVWLIVFFVFDLYNLRRSNPNPLNIGLLLIAVWTNILITGLSFYLFSIVGIAPKTNLVIVGVVACTLLVLWRRLFYNLFSETYPLSVVLVGTSSLFSSLEEELRLHPQLGNVRGKYNSISEVPPTPINVLIVESFPSAQAISAMRSRNVEVFTLGQAYEVLLGKYPVRLMTEEKALAIITKRKSGIHAFSRLFEIVTALLILIITSPILLVAAMAILIEDGKPILYKQSRVGEHGKIFFIYKLRSMRTDAEKDGAQWAQKSDARITRVGAILRKTHIDEIPQMWNILRGDIALVGPRPERPEIVTTLEAGIPYYYLRHTQKPGFTGWAQIKFRYARSIMDSEEKFAYDLYYLLNRNPLLDIGIVLKTLQIIFTH